MKYIVYKHTTPNQKVYIGITCNIPKKRWNYGKGYLKCPLFYNAILKYGWNNIKHEILFTNLSAKQAKDKEKELIAYYKSNQRKYGYNLTNGGDGAEGYKHTQETRLKMSLNHYNCSGKNNPMYNTKMSEEHKKLLISYHLGIPRKEETKEKISLALKGIKRSEEFKQKHKGKNNWSYGRKGSKSATAKPIIQLNQNGEFIKTWDSITEASIYINVTVQSICKALKRGTNCKGYKWKYKG